MADRLGHSSVILTLDTYSHVTPAMDHAAASLIAGLVTPSSEDLLAVCWPLPDSEDQKAEAEMESRRSSGVGRPGSNPEPAD